MDGERRVKKLQEGEPGGGKEGGPRLRWIGCCLIVLQEYKSFGQNSMDIFHRRSHVKTSKGCSAKEEGTVKEFLIFFRGKHYALAATQLKSSFTGHLTLCTCDHHAVPICEAPIM
jgi:hypothetical protein